MTILAFCDIMLLMKSVKKTDFAAARKLLESGGILAVPTETVYGLAVSADNTEAIRRLFELKKRQVGGGKILTLMLSDVDEMAQFVQMNRRAKIMARHYFPGELTLILPKANNFRHPYFDNFSTVGIRIPAHDYMLKLIKKTGPLLVTSANPRGEAPCQDSKEVKRRLPDIDGVVEGQAGGNIPSTIIDFSGNRPQPIRQGGLLIVRYY